MSHPSGEMTFEAFMVEYRRLLREYYRDPFANPRSLVIVRRRLSLPAQAVLLRVLLFDAAAAKQIRQLERHIRELRDQRILRYKHPPQPDKDAAERIRAEQELRDRERDRKWELLELFLIIYEYALLEAERDLNPIPYELEAAAYSRLPAVAKRYLQRTLTFEYESTLVILDYESRRRRRLTWRPTPGKAYWLPTLDQYLAARAEQGDPPDPRRIPRRKDKPPFG